MTNGNTLCDRCAEKVEPEHDWGHCPHRGVLFVRDPDGGEPHHFHGRTWQDAQAAYDRAVELGAYQAVFATWRRMAQGADAETEVDGAVEASQANFLKTLISVCREQDAAERNTPRH